MTEQLIPPHGGYKELLTFQKAEIVYDALSSMGWFPKRRAKRC